MVNQTLVTAASPNLRRFSRFSGAAALVAGVLLACTTAQAQTWTWISGSNVVSQPCANGTVPGTLNFFSPTSHPGGRAGAATWTDKYGHVWLFGGSSCSGGWSNDMWEFDPSQREWAWRGGSTALPRERSGVRPSYGMLGVFAAGNMPGAREDATTWTDQRGLLWLFGGYGVGNVEYYEGALNELWAFDPTTRLWAWMGGTKGIPQNVNRGYPGQYGTHGIFAPGNTPGGRSGATGWMDKSGHLWLFGGRGTDTANTYGLLNDLWEFDPSSRQWRWRGGSRLAGSDGVHATLGVASSEFFPGCRAGASGWTDPNGNLWVFGGYGIPGRRSDLWFLNPATMQWTYLGGGTAGNSTPTWPGGGSSASSWTDRVGNLWLFGEASNGANELWRYNPPTRKWTKMENGSADVTTRISPGVYGTRGVPAKGNTPGGRVGASAWVDQTGSLWLFGGLGYDAAGNRHYLNDLWHYPLETYAPTFSSSTGTYANDLSITLADDTVGSVIYYTTDGTTPTTASTKYSGSIAVTKSQTIKAFAGQFGYKDSPVVTTTYTLKAASPVLNLASGTYYQDNNLYMKSATVGATIYYTTNGTKPTASSTRYTGPILISASQQITAVAIKANYLPSDVASATFKLELQPPIFSPPAGTYTNDIYIRASTDLTPNLWHGVEFYYTTDGTTPTINSTKYNGPIKISTALQFKVIAVKPGYLTSPVVSARYNLLAAPPTFSPVGGTYSNNQSVTLSTITTGAVSFYYYLNETGPLLYTGPIAVAGNATISAISVKAGYSVKLTDPNPPFSTATYQLKVAPPAFSLAAGSYPSSRTLTLTTTTSGAVIYYTTDGTKPTINSPRYSGPIAITRTQTVKAIGIKAQYQLSDVVAATYTLPQL